MNFEDERNTASLLEFLIQYSENSLHVASKNGHNDIIRLLLVHKVVDINSVSERFQGTALHEACRHGRLQTVKLLLECGCDVSQQNQLGQSASDVIIRQKVGNDIRCLIKEYGQAVCAVSVQAYLSCHSGALNFEAKELVVVLERPDAASGHGSNSEIYSSLGAGVYGSGVVTYLWRGFILDRRNFTSRFGYFPSNCVRLIEPKEARRDSPTAGVDAEIYSSGSRAG